MAPTNSRDQVIYHGLRPTLATAKVFMVGDGVVRLSTVEWTADDQALELQFRVLVGQQQYWHPVMVGGEPLWLSRKQPRVSINFDGWYRVMPAGAGAPSAIAVIEEYQAFDGDLAGVIADGGACCPSGAGSGGSGTPDHVVAAAPAVNNAPEIPTTYYGSGANYVRPDGWIAIPSLGGLLVPYVTP